tara:strand:- start:6043 stop:6441 length:399 start_codon:yes stop_codon:yes gene_type:complete
MTLVELGTKVAALISYTEGTNMFLGTLPSTPDVCAAVYETGGTAPTYALGQAAPIFHNAGTQFVFRGSPNDYAGPRAVAKTAFDGLIALQNVDLTGVRYYFFSPQQDPFPMGPDENGRVRIVFNMLLMKDPS